MAIYNPVNLVGDAAINNKKGIESVFSLKKVIFYMVSFIISFAFSIFSPTVRDSIRKDLQPIFGQDPPVENKWCRSFE